jgi:CheY-like chemotaxis protein
VSGCIFIVDDNPVNLSVLAGILRSEGYEARIANSGRRALEAVKLDLPDLIMLDVSMPEMNGYQICTQLKADARTRDVPVIFLSALDDVQDKINGFRAGGVDYVTKPFHTEEVVVRVESQLKLARARRALEEKNRELAEKNEELMRARRTNELVFTTLADVLNGSVLDGKYLLEEKIGMGGFAAVYRAKHLGLERPVAVKILRPHSGRDAKSQLEQFRIEGISATRVNHPNAVSVHDLGLTESGVAYLVMELLIGRTLADELADAGPLSLSRCKAIIVPICEALAEAHRASIIHRDIKPSNIFLHQSGGQETVKVVDFGVAKHFEHEHAGISAAGRVLGTPVYISPERLLEQPYDGRADAYSVGVMLYQMISGQLPFEPKDGSLAAMVSACSSDAPRPLREAAPEVPPGVDAIVMRALARRPEQRLTVNEIAMAVTLAIDPADPTRSTGPLAHLDADTLPG